MSKRKKTLLDGFWDFFRVRPKKRTVKARGKGTLFYNPGKIGKSVFYVSNVLFLIFVVGAVWLYGPLLRVVLRYKFGPGIAEPVIIPPQLDDIDVVKLLDMPSGEFSINIPKIEAKSKVIANVNSANKTEYMTALRDGVAHAAGSKYPGQGETIYLFAHSTASGLNQVRFNAVFYLLDELIEGDLVQVVKDEKLYEYVVTDKKVVGPKEVEYLNYKEDGEVLVLQTCWPIGTTLKRLLIFARPR